MKSSVVSNYENKTAIKTYTIHIENVCRTLKNDHPVNTVHR